MAVHGVPRWVWVFPAASAIAAVLAWTVWCNTERGTFVHESLPHRRGFRGALGAWAVALLAGAAATGIVFLVAGLGYYLRCPPF